MWEVLVTVQRGGTLGYRGLVWQAPMRVWHPVLGSGRQYRKGNLVETLQLERSLRGSLVTVLHKETAQHPLEGVCVPSCKLTPDIRHVELRYMGVKGTEPRPPSLGRITQPLSHVGPSRSVTCNVHTP